MISKKQVLAFLKQHWKLDSAVVMAAGALLSGLVVGLALNPAVEHILSPKAVAENIPIIIDGTVWYLLFMGSMALWKRGYDRYIKDAVM